VYEVLFDELKADTEWATSGEDEAYTEEVTG